MICGYQDRTFHIGKTQKIEIAFKDRAGKPYKIGSWGNPNLSITNIFNEAKKDIDVYGFTNDPIEGTISFYFDNPTFSEDEDFFKKDDEDIYGRGELSHAYSITMTTDKSQKRVCVLRGLARLVRIA